MAAIAEALVKIVPDLQSLQRDLTRALGDAVKRAEKNAASADAARQADVIDIRRAK